jgi:hypothetical protein
MLSVTKRKVIALIVAIILTIAFLWDVLTPGSIFNALPFELHESSGMNMASESDFIRGFDYCFSVIVLILSYFLLRRFFDAYGLLK